jgi:hypothetical protein
VPLTENLNDFGVVCAANGGKGKCLQFWTSGAAEFSGALSTEAIVVASICIGQHTKRSVRRQEKSAV